MCVCVCAYALMSFVMCVCVCMHVSMCALCSLPLLPGIVLSISPFSDSLECGHPYVSSVHYHIPIPLADSH